MDLDFSDCDVGEDGARAIAEHLPKKLTSLNLSFSGEEDLNIGGARAVAEHLPKELTVLYVDERMIYAKCM